MGRRELPGFWEAGEWLALSNVNVFFNRRVFGDFIASGEYGGGYGEFR